MWQVIHQVFVVIVVEIPYASQSAAISIMVILGGGQDIIADSSVNVNVNVWMYT